MAKANTGFPQRRREGARLAALAVAAGAVLGFESAFDGGDPVADSRHGGRRGASCCH